MSIWQITYCCQIKSCPAHRQIHQITIAEGPGGPEQLNAAIEEKRPSYEKCSLCNQYTKKHFVIYDIFTATIRPPTIHQ
jgi:hypothetical protein